MNRCDICGKESKHCCKRDGVVYCPKHYQQCIKFGHVLDHNPRTTKDLNDFELLGDAVRVFVYNRHCKRYGSFVIDLEDLDRVIIKKWRIVSNRVVTGVHKSVHISRFILDIKDPKAVVDHIDSDPLNNRKSNLRVTTQQKNLCNKRVQSNNTSSVAGVYFCNKRNKWCSEIMFDYKKCFLGRHNAFCDAVYVKYVAEMHLFEDYRSKLNDAHIYDMVEKCSNKQRLNAYVSRRIRERYGITINIE